MKKYLLIIFLICTLFILSACGVNPAAKFPAFYFDYQDEIHFKTITDKGDYDNDVPIEVNNDVSMMFSTYGTSITVSSETLDKVVSFKLGTEKETDGFYTAYYFGGDKEYIIIHAWERKSWDNVTRYKLHQGSAMTYLDDLTVDEYKAQTIPLITHSNHLYYFDTLSIYRLSLDANNNAENLYTLPFKKGIPNTGSSKNTTEADYYAYLFSIADTSICLYGEERFGQGSRNKFTTITLD